MKIVMTLIALSLFATALVGCRAEGEVGDANSRIVAPR
jgi:hypothetical protein